jgi:uncharacterized protein YdhG (YjbR/CyaY superfamily)
MALADIDAYLQTLSFERQQIMQKLRRIVREAAPHSRECISYGMPAFKQHGVLVYFSSNKNHIGFYPTSQPIIVFAERLKPFRTSKGAIQFLWDVPLPEELIKDIVSYRVQEDQMQYEVKLKGRKM